MASLVAWLKYVGARKANGDPVASGRAYFYQPGTVSTPVTVYSDKDGLVALTQPVALDAGGRAVVYAKTPVKVEVQQAVDFAVQAVEDRSNTVNAKQVEVENANYLGTDLVGGGQVLGGRTDLDTVLSGLVGTGGGSGGNYQESASATARTLQVAIGDHIKLQDFGAVGDDVADDTAAIAAAVARAIASNKPLWIEPGTYRFSGPIALSTASAAGLKITGANRAACILKNVSGTGNAITVDLGSAMESDIEMSDFTITHTGTSTGRAIEFVNGNGGSLRRITVAGHRYGFDVNAVSFAMLEDCHVLSLDAHASSRGFRLGTGCMAHRCRVTAATNGIAFSLLGQWSRADLCRAAADSGTGFEMLVSDSQCHSCMVTGTPATGFSIGAVSRSGCIGCTSTLASTADFATNASAASPVDIGNVFTTRVQNEGGGHQWMSARMPVLKRNVVVTHTADSGFSGTPDPTKGSLQVLAWIVSGAAAGRQVTINNTSTVGLVDGQVMTVVVENQSTGAAQILTVLYGSQYRGVTAGGDSAGAGGGTYRAYQFVWRAASSQWVLLGSTTQLTLTTPTVWT